MERNPIRLSKEIVYTVADGIDQHIAGTYIRVLSGLGGVTSNLIKDSRVTRACLLAGVTLAATELVRSYRDGRRKRVRNINQ